MDMESATQRRPQSEAWSKWPEEEVDVTSEKGIHHGVLKIKWVL